MARNSNAVFSSNVQTYPLYNEKQYMPYTQNYLPQTIATIPSNQQYYRAASPLQPAFPVQNYRVSATSPIRVSQSVLQQPQVLPAQKVPVYLNPAPNTRVSYDNNASIVGTVYPQTGQSVVRKMMPVTQYVPIDVIETAPVVTVTPAPHPSVIYGEPVVVAPAQQRVIIDEPQIYEKRQIKYTPPAASKVTKIQKTVVQEVKRQAYRDPMVQTVQKSFDGASVRSSRVAPPPAKIQETKTPCSIWLLALLGLLGLIGLILAIVLSQNSKSSTTAQSSQIKIASPQRVSQSVPIAPKVTPIQPLVSTPTPVLIPNTNPIETTPSFTTPPPTEISVAKPAVVNTNPTVLTGVQPQTIAPIFVSTNRAGSSSSTTTNSSITQPHTVQPTPTTQPTTVQPATVDWIPAFSGSTSSTSPTVAPTSVSPQTSTTTSQTSTSSTSIQPQTVSPTSVASSSNTPGITTTTTTTVTTKPSHFLSLRHHL